MTTLDHVDEFALLPEIYQVELTAACDLACPMCLRTTTMDRKPTLLKMELLEQMHSRGEFAGTAFIELQMAGEPTIHPELGRIIQFLKNHVGLMVGLSTHGLNLAKPSVLEACMELDALTVSIDSVDPEIYHKMRYPAKLEDLERSLSVFMKEYISRDLYSREVVPFLEFQLVKTPLVPGSGNIAALEQFVKDHGWEHSIRIRTNKDSFMEMDGRMIAGTMPRPKHGQICLNPFSSVSVNQDGDVLSCCQIFQANKSEINYYGNLYKNTLEEIWNNERVREMRRQHRAGQLTDQCAKCYSWSPVQIHNNIVRGIVRARN